MRVVLDTNVIVSRFLSPSGNPARIIDYWYQGRFSVLLSEPILTEIKRVFGYPHLRKRHGLSDHEISEVVEGLRQFAELVVPHLSLKIVADSDDDKFIECAVAGGAQFIVSGDRHLLDVVEYRGIPILRPAEFLQLIEVGS